MSKSVIVHNMNMLYASSPLSPRPRSYCHQYVVCTFRHTVFTSSPSNQLLAVLCDLARKKEQVYSTRAREVCLVFIYLYQCVLSFLLGTTANISLRKNSVAICTAAHHLCHLLIRDLYQVLKYG